MVPVPEQAVAAERLAADHRAGDAAVDVEVADRRAARSTSLDRVRVAREEPAGERERGARRRASHASSTIAHALDGQQRPEDLLAQHRRVRRAGRRRASAAQNQPLVGHRRAPRGDPAVAAPPRRRSGRRAPAPRARSPAARRSPKRVGLADLEHLDRAREALDAARRRSPRARARARRPSTSGRRSRRRTGTIAGTASSRSASESTITQFLPPISATTRLRWRWPSGVSAAARMISRPTALEPVKAIVCTRGSRDQRGADVALAGQQRERVRAARRPRAAPRRARSAQPGDCSAGLRTTALPVASAAAVMPQRDRQREVPRRDHGGDAARRVAHRVALARDLEQRRALRRARRASRA